MAKKKAADPTSPKSTPAAKSAKPSSAPAKPKAARTAAAPARPLTSEEIGHVAGAVWRTLSEGGEQTLAALKKSVGAPDDLVVAALGWLAREDKLAFTSNGRSVKVSLL